MYFARVFGLAVTFAVEPLSPMRLVAFVLTLAGGASARKIVEIRLEAALAIFLLRKLESERPRLDQCGIGLSVDAKRSINAARFLFHGMAPIFKRDWPGRWRVK